MTLPAFLVSRVSTAAFERDLYASRASASLPSVPVRGTPARPWARREAGRLFWWMLKSTAFGVSFTSARAVFEVGGLLLPQCSRAVGIDGGILRAGHPCLTAKKAQQRVKILRDGKIDAAFHRAVRRDGAAVLPAVSRVDDDHRPLRHARWAKDRQRTSHECSAQ